MHRLWRQPYNVLARLRSRASVAVIASLTIGVAGMAPSAYAAPTPIQPIRPADSTTTDHIAQTITLQQPITPPKSAQLVHTTSGIPETQLVTGLQQQFNPPQPLVASMLVTGPLDYYEQECFGCADPWGSNHSISGVTSLASTPPAIDAPHPRSIALASAQPTFQVNVEFDSNGSIPGATDNPFPGVFAVRHGDVANFEVTLERCDAPQTRDPNGAPPPPAPECTDYGGNPGNWQQAGANAVAIGLPAPNAAGQAQLQLTDSTTFDLGSLSIGQLP